MRLESLKLLDDVRKAAELGGMANGEWRIQNSELRSGVSFSLFAIRHSRVPASFGGRGHDDQVR